MLSALEFRRQLLHIAFGTFLVTMLYFDIFNVYHLIIILITGITISLVSRKIDLPLIKWVMHKFERAEYRKTFPGKGPICYMLGSVLVVYFFPKDIALASMMILAVGDGVSHIAGKLLSRKKFKYLKSIEGTIAGIIFAFAAALPFVAIGPAALASSITMLAEGIRLNVDDNFFIPVIAAMIMTAFT